MSINMKRPPVIYTVAQLKFNNHPDMGSSFAELSPLFRELGYPDIREQAQKGVKIEIENNSPKVSTEDTPTWIFNNIEQVEGFVLKNDAIAFHTTRYRGHQAFLKTFLQGVKVLCDIKPLAFVERLGLRYINCIPAENETQLASFIQPSLLGLSNLFRGHMIHSFCEAVGGTEHGQIVARVFMLADGIAMPPDVVNNMAITMTIPPREGEARFATLDIDHSKEERVSFDFDQVDVHIRHFHQHIHTLFFDCLTDAAKEAFV
jgi:uncharacterized protein (TIGR04255 family)